MTIDELITLAKQTYDYAIVKGCTPEVAKDITNQACNSALKADPIMGKHTVNAIVKDGAVIGLAQQFK